MLWVYFLYINSIKYKKEINIMENLVGQKFNHWTVLKFDEERSASSRKNFWICECDCENHTIKSVRSDNLKSGKSKSCGCYNRACAAERMRKIGQNTVVKQDLTGKQFGYWYVESRAENQNNHVAWNCICKCGTKRIVLGQSLKNGTSQSCGCLNMSHGEKKIKDLLEQNHINFIQEYPIADLWFSKESNKARFDFYIENKYAIEFDGEQHFMEMSDDGYFKHNVDTIQEHDKIKNQYCKEHNIPIIRIPYTHLKDICLEDLIPETSKFLVEQ